MRHQQQKSKRCANKDIRAGYMPPIMISEIKNAAGDFLFKLKHLKNGVLAKLRHNFFGCFQRNLFILELLVLVIKIFGAFNALQGNCFIVLLLLD